MCLRSVLWLVAQSCLIFCNSTDGSPPGPSVHGDSPGKNTGVGCQALLQGNLPNPGTEPRSPTLQVDSLLVSHIAGGASRAPFLLYYYFFLPIYISRFLPVFPLNCYTPASKQQQQQSKVEKRQIFLFPL